MNRILEIKPNTEAPNYFHLSGKLTHETCMHFIHEINKGMNPFVDTVTLNFICLDSIDGSGVGVIVTLAICLKHQRKRLVIVAPNDRQPRSLLQFLELENLVGVS